MFFSGDPSSRKRVDLGGRSSKERDRQKLLEQTRLERKRRLFQREQNSAAIKIQVCLFLFNFLYFCRPLYGWIYWIFGTLFCGYFSDVQVDKLCWVYNVLLHFHVLYFLYDLLNWWLINEKWSLWVEIGMSEVDMYLLQKFILVNFVAMILFLGWLFYVCGSHYYDMYLMPLMVWYIASGRLCFMPYYCVYADTTS